MALKTRQVATSFSRLPEKLFYPDVHGRIVQKLFLHKIPFVFWKYLGAHGPHGNEATARPTDPASVVCRRRLDELPVSWASRSIHPVTGWQLTEEIKLIDKNCTITRWRKKLPIDWSTSVVSRCSILTKTAYNLRFLTVFSTKISRIDFVIFM